MEAFLKPFFAAVGFLTVLPVPRKWAGGVKELGRSLPFFTMIGLMIGALAALMDLGVRFILPMAPASVITVMALIVASGGLHLDGLADTADGFFSSRPRRRILEIMKDSRIGTMGVGAIVCVVLLKFSVLASLDGWTRFYTILLAPAAGRFATVLMITSMKYIRSDSGLGAAFSRNRSYYTVIASFCLLAAMGWLGLDIKGLVCAAAAPATTWLFSLYCVKKIGGYTGDTLGAACELVETATFLTVLIYLHIAANGLSFPF